MRRIFLSISIAAISLEFFVFSLKFGIIFLLLISFALLGNLSNRIMKQKARSIEKATLVILPNRLRHI